MNKSIKILCLLFLGLIFACEKEDHTPATCVLGESFELSMDRPTSSQGCDEILMTYSTVTEDSRCPEGAMCIWEGRVVVEFDLQIDSDRYDLTLISRAGHEYLSKDTLRGYIFTLEEVAPYPNSSGNFQEEDYRFTVRISNL